MRHREDRWASLSPQQAGQILNALTVPWWIAGGWAVDAFLRRPTRAHGDRDIGIFRQDVLTVCRLLPDWAFFASHQGQRDRLPPGTPPSPFANSLWAQPTGSETWQLEFLLDVRDADDWVFRRDPRIRRPISEALWMGSEGFRFLSPGIQLLYKAAHPRPKDEADFESLRPQLPEPELRWLRDALEVAHPGHPWGPRLAAGAGVPR